MAIQNHYNLIYREEEREMNLRQDHRRAHTLVAAGAGVFAGSYPGWLRSRIDRPLPRAGPGAHRRAVPRPARFPDCRAGRGGARKYGTSRAQVCIAWLLGKPGVVAPVVGVSRVAQIKDLAAGTSLTLDPADVDYLEEPYEPLVNLLSIGSS